MTSITIRYGHRHFSAVPVNGAATTYYSVVTGLANGVKYTFTVEVCNSFHRCTTSKPVTFMPYGVPKPPVVTGAVRGQHVRLTWGRVDRQFSPFPWTCRVQVTGNPADAAAPTLVTDPNHRGSTTFTGVPGTAYTADYICSMSGYRTVVSHSQVITVPATPLS